MKSLELNFSIGKMPIYSDYQIESEPTFFACSYEFLLKNGGPISISFLELLFQERPDIDKSKIIFDTKSSKLEQGWYAGAPGWHQDGAVWNEPDTQYALGLIDENICLTEFLEGDVVFKTSETSFNNKLERDSAFELEVDALIERKQLQAVTALHRQITYFNAYTVHRCTPAIKAGWRWRCRATWNTARAYENRIIKPHAYGIKRE